MLFMHKGADRGINYAVFTGVNPKGNSKSYELIEKSRVATVKQNVQSLAPRLGVPFETVPHLLKLLDQWLLCTAHDRAKSDIYGMMSPDGMDARKKAKLPANWRYYNNYVDLVLALNGDVLSEFNLMIESKLAKLVLFNFFINIHILNVAKKISDLAIKYFKDNERDALLNGKYKSLHKNHTWQNWLAALTPTIETGELVSCLYDITMSFKEPLKWKEEPMAKGRITKVNMRMNVSTPNEDFNWTASARRANVPVWAAPSYTAHLMLLVAKEAGASTEEIQAFAYGIYAYWNIEYPQTATPIHRMYGVMTAAHEFGVSGAACDPTTMYLALEKFISPGVAKL